MVIEAILFMAILAFILGLILVWASKKFAIKPSELVENLEKALPGYNCGACGYAGCKAYAEALAKGEVEPNLCKPGKKETEDKIKEILGK